MQVEYFVNHNGKDLGPFSKEQIENKVHKKELFPSDYVYVEAKDDWILLEEFIKPIGDKKAVAHAKVQVQQVVHSPKHNTSVRISEGEAKVQVSNEKIGKLKIEVVEKKGIKAQVAEVNIVAGPAHELRIDMPVSVQAGQPLKVSVRALDKFGNLDTRFNGQLKVDSQSKVEGLGLHTFKAGVIHYEMKMTKAEKVEFKHSSPSHSTLKMQSSVVVQVTPAPASEIKVEAQAEARAGEEVGVTVRAYDAFGNLDTNYSEVITLRLSGTSSGESEVRMNNGVGSLKVS